MSKLLGFVLLFVGAFTFFFGQWIAFDIFMQNKLSKINKNIAHFSYGIYSGESLIKIPFAEENVFVFRTRDGKVITTSNTVERPFTEDFSSTQLLKDGDSVQVYIKRPSLGEYVLSVLERPMSIGISLSGLLLFLLGIYLVISAGSARTMQVPEVKREVIIFDEELLKNLKALRSALAMSDLIPAESSKEAKKLIDNIINKAEAS